VKPFNARAVVALLGFAAAPVLSAASVNASCTGVPLSNTELSASITCPQFGGSNLTQIDIAFSGAIEGAITLTNDGATDQNVSGSTESQFFLGLLGGFVIPSPLFSATFDTGVVSLGAGTSQTFGGLTGSANGNITNTSAGTFAAYSGAGSFSIPVSTLTGLTVTGGGGQIQAGQTTQASIDAVVTYTFEDQPPPPGEVPEPGTLAITGIGALALGFAGRRRPRS